MILFSSSVTRSMETILMRWALRLMASNDSGSMQNLSCEAKRTARIIRNGSSEQVMSGSRGVRSRSSMVLHRLLHHIHLLWCEPLQQPFVGSHYLPTCHVVYRPWPLKSQVMVCRYGVCHVDIRAKSACQTDRPPYHAVGMAEVVRLVKLIVPWQYLLLQEYQYSKRDRLKLIFFYYLINYIG